jgi:hypothetical protein
MVFGQIWLTLLVGDCQFGHIMKFGKKENKKKKIIIVVPRIMSLLPNLWLPLNHVFMFVILKNSSKW